MAIQLQELLGQGLSSMFAFSPGCMSTSVCINHYKTIKEISLKFALQWGFKFDEVSYGTIKEYDVDEVTNINEAISWIDEHTLKLQQDLKVPCHIDDDIEWNWHFFEGTVADLYCEEIDKIQWLSSDELREIVRKTAKLNFDKSIVEKLPEG